MGPDGDHDLRFGVGGDCMPRYDVFVSHGPSDRHSAQQLTRELRSRGLTVWLDIDDPSPAGDVFFHNIARALENSTAIVVLVSPEVGLSPNHAAEIGAADRLANSGDHLLIPVYLTDSASTRAPLGIERYAGISAHDLHMDDVAEKIARALARHPAATVLPERKCPDSERVLGSGHQSTLTIRQNLAETYQALGRESEAAALLEQTLADSERVLGPDHPTTLTVRANLAGNYHALGRQSEAAALLERTLADSERVLGLDHPSTFTVRANLAGSYQVLGRQSEAAALLERTLADSQRVLGPDHPTTLTVRANLAGNYQALGRQSEAAALLEKTFADSERVLGPDDPLTLTVRRNLAYVRGDMKPTGQ